VAVDRLLRFHRPWTGRWKTPTGEAWQPALALDAVLNAYESTRDPRYVWVVERSFGRYRRRRSHFYDDDGWYLNVWLRAYDLTGDPKYLVEAEELFVGMTTAWDDHCRGGLWWSKDRAYKNAITNELFLLAAARLARRCAPRAVGPNHRAWALRAWSWFESSGMINAQHLVNDGLDNSCANNGGVVWTYNQGVILGALTELWRVTGDRQLPSRAVQIADAAIAALTSPAGVLREPCEPHRCSGNNQVFKGVFVQGLARLYPVVAADRPGYREFLHANAESVWHHARDGDNGFGLRWDGPPVLVTAATQTSASLLLGAVALLDAGGETSAVPPPGDRH
jgi:predicted alpha-1,6-mannanase (GH76 family)